MSSCGRVIGGGAGYRMICGGLWCGSVVYCDRCEDRNTQRRILEKQEALLDKQLKGDVHDPR